MCISSILLLLLVDLKTDRFISNVGGPGDIAVVVNSERERLGIQREALGSNSLLEGVGVSR